MKLSISKVKIDEQLYPRAQLDPMHVARLTAALQSGAQFPAIVVEARTYRLVDGRNRCEACKAIGIKTIEALEKTYRNEADLFADAVRLNSSHGLPLDAESVRSAVLRLYGFGYTREAISEVTRVPVDHLEVIRRGYKDKQNGQPIAVKGYKDEPVVSDKEKERARRFSSEKAMFYVKQLDQMFADDLYPRTRLFGDAMDDLVRLWTLTKPKMPT